MGGVTGALLDIRRGGRDVGMELRRKANGWRDEGLGSFPDGLGKEEEDGLGWYEGIGLAKYEDGGLGCLEELGVMFVEVPPISIGQGLHPCNDTFNQNPRNHNWQKLNIQD